VQPPCRNRFDRYPANPWRGIPSLRCAPFRLLFLQSLAFRFFAVKMVDMIIMAVLAMELMNDFD
jgi:hypothetical protein